MPECLAIYPTDLKSNDSNHPTRLRPMLVVQTHQRRMQPVRQRDVSSIGPTQAKVGCKMGGTLAKFTIHRYEGQVRRSEQRSQDLPRQGWFARAPADRTAHFIQEQHRRDDPTGGCVERCPPGHAYLMF
jgi:hypothetical protein